MKEKLNAGSIGWVDITVPDAEYLKDFYADVIGWDPQRVSMGDYNDFNMVSPRTGEPNAGICHKKGVNKLIPSVWMLYFIVDNIDSSIENVKRLGGNVIVDPKRMSGQGKYAVIQDPAGAYCALFEQE